METMSSNLPGSAPLSAYTDKLTIDTPEQTALDFAIAGIGSRFLALALDTLIQILVSLIVGIGGGVAIFAVSTVLPKGAIWGSAILVLFFFFLYFGYFALFEIIWNGQTPGKRKAGIRVIKDSGRPLTPAETIARNLLRIVDWLPGFYAIGLASALLNKENKRLGDLVAGSIVIRETAISDLKLAWQVAEAPADPVLSSLGAANLTPDELALIDSFLTRRSELDYDVRVRMADQIFSRLKPKLTIPAENSLSVEKILETLAYERRASGRYS
jgi:uncharacterized RDD family membrane protein YckC